MREKNLLTNGIVVCFAALFCNFLWGSAFPMIKIGYQLYGIPAADVATQILFAGCQFTLAGILSVAAGSILQRRFLCPTPSAVPKIVRLSLFQTVGQYLLFYIGLANTTGVRAAVIEGSSVFVTILIAGFLFRMERVTRRKMLGCVLGFSGVVLVNLAGSSITWQFHFNGEGFILLSTIAYAMSTVLLKRDGKTENPVLLSGWQFILGGLVMAVVGRCMGGRLSIQTGQQGLVLVYLAFLSAAAYTIWGLLLKYNPVSRISVYGFSNPVFGVLLSALLLEEENHLGLSLLVALGLVCAGIWTVNQTEKVDSAPPISQGG